MTGIGLKLFNFFQNMKENITDVVSKKDLNVLGSVFFRLENYTVIKEVGP